MREGGRLLHPSGSVGVVTGSPSDLKHSYRVRFPDNVEAPLKLHEVMLLSQFKEGAIGDSSLTAGRSNLFDRVISVA